MKQVIAVFSVFALMVGVTVSAGSAPDLKDVKCLVSGQPAKETHSVEYKDAKVFFCCPNCPKGYEADTKKFETKANRQLVETKQYKAKACPFSGRGIAKKTSEGPEVGFCCNNCLGRYEKMSEEEKLEAVFAAAPFEKGFELKKEEEKK